MPSLSAVASRQRSSTAEALSSADLIEQLARHEARESFWAFRQYMRPTLVKGWWARLVAAELQQFLGQLIAGENPTLLLQAPPQHGKSWTVIDFLAWASGKHPHLRSIFASFSDRLGVRANLALQRYYDSPRYQAVFPALRIASKNAVTVSQQTLRNREIIEYADADGYFRNTTVLGSITGESLDLGVIDDPIKGRKEANSETVRNGTWDWLTDDFMSRFSKAAGLLMTMTRWHVDDPAGRLQQEGWPVRVVSFPAIATEDEEYRKKGDALFPALKPLSFLLARKALMIDASWEALYQQRPYIRGGGLFPVDQFQIVDARPPSKDIAASARYWDKAGTAGDGAHTAGVLMHRLRDGRYFVEDVVRGQWSALDREKRLRQTAEVDGKGIRIFVEQEPGSGGKESAEATIRMLAGWRAFADRVTGDKETRAEPYAAQVQGGNVMLKRGEWNRAFLDEHESFPASKYKDQVDAAAGAFAKVAVAGLDYEALTRM
ncbi:phage terminase large subunit [Marinibaculum pumilum]|uniref:Phage terminase large subunit n=1 Tax=Marinibaculum pumilum TaxID=1766165 RepID=A0ABV7KY71_9PROT